MTEVIRALQVAFVLAWFIPIVLFARQAWARATSSCDRLAASTWYTAVSIVAFPIRWLLQGGPISQIPNDQLLVWSALYVLGSIAAVYLSVAVKVVCNERS